MKVSGYLREYDEAKDRFAQRNFEGLLAKKNGVIHARLQYLNGPHKIEVSLTSSDNRSFAGTYHVDGIKEGRTALERFRRDGGEVILVGMVEEDRRPGDPGIWYFHFMPEA